ncbi:MAG: invasion associated locus family protein, partial [Alphaproteobacteria bacterium]|nr:invasion associated locus family protein [Alphaproteobacteria bacterium]
MKSVYSKKLRHILTGAAGGVLLACAAAFAQDAAPAPAAPAGVGRPEVKTVGDWMVRCFPVASPGPCDIYQELDDQRTRQRVLSFSIAYIPSLNRHGIQITVPLEVSIQKGLTIITDSYTSPVMKFRYCDRTGCFVQMPMDNAAIESISKSGPDAKVRIFADNGKAYDLRFSLKGFAAAHDSMAEQARAKGKSPA